VILLHYTCAHAAPKIEAAGALTGYPHTMLPQVGPIVWLTDLDVGARRELGLPAIQAGCDRMAYRVRVELPAPLRWPSWARRTLHKAQWTALETNFPGAMIAHWWLSLDTPLPILSIEPNQ
jgi:hypothetical protein